MVRIPSLSRREAVPTRDENSDGRIDVRDERPATEPTDPVGRTGADPERTVDTRPAAGRASATAPEQTIGADPTEVPKATPTPEVIVDRGPRPRASMLATVSLILGVVGVLFVLTGTLSGYGIGVGAVGALLAVGGLAATRRRHVAGRSDSLLGMLLGLTAVVLGVLAMTGQFDWPSTDGDWVQRFREWLDSQFVSRF